MKFFIAAPFGNYLKFTGKNNVIPVTGTWTLDSRATFLKRIYKIITTLRYDFKKDGWVNRLGLPNPGVKTGLSKTVSREILSIAAINRSDWSKLYEIVGDDINIEINLSCPNLDEKSNLFTSDDLKLFTSKKSKNKNWCIAKVSPYTTLDELKYLINDLGFSQIHCCNTLPVVHGGLSGKPLKPYVQKLIKLIRKNWGDKIEIIAGGGVDSIADVNNYINLGANHISLGTVSFKPWKIGSIVDENL